MSGTIRGIRVEIGAETSGLHAALKDVNNASRDIAKELRQVENLLKFNPQNTEALAQKQQLLGDQVATTAEKLRRLKEVQEQVVEQFAKGDITVEQYRAFQRELVKTESQLKNYEKQLKSVNSQNNEFVQKTAELGKKLEGIGKKMSDVGKKLSLKVTAPIAALGTVAAKSAIDFESAFAGVRKTVDATEQEFAKLSDGIRQMAKEIPASAVEIAGVAEAAGQLGIVNDHILSFTRTMIDLGEATNMSADTAATSLARLANIMQMPQDSFDKLGSTIVALGNSLATTESEIVDMGLRLAGAGKQVGMTEAQVLSLAGALSSVGIAAEAGGSAFSKVLVNMQLAVETGGGALENFASVAGMTAEQFRAAFQEDATGALIAFIQGLQSAEDRGMSAIKVLDDMGITEVRMRDALLRAAGAGDLFTEAVQLGTEAWEENIALTNEAEQRYGTTASKIEIMRNKLNEVAITFGEILLPPLIAVIDKIGVFADWLSNLNPILQRVVLLVGGLAAAIGPLLIIAGKLVTSVGVLLPILGKLAAFMKTTLIPAFTSTVLPVMGVVAAVAAVIAIGVEMYRAWDEIKNALNATWELLKASAERLGLNMALSFENMKLSVISAVNEILERLSVLENLPFGLGDKFAGLKSSVSAGVDGSKQKIEELRASLVENSSRMSEAIEGTKIAFGDLGTKIAEDVKSVIGAITGQTKATAEEYEEQTEIITEEQEEQTEVVSTESTNRVEITQDSEEEQTEIVSEEAQKRAEERAKYEQSWNDKLFKLTATRLEQLDAELQREIAIAEELGADKTAIYEYYSIKRQEILDNEVEREKEREQKRLNALAKFEEDWAKKLFEYTATRLETLEQEKQESLKRAEELGADKSAIIEYYALKQQEILDEELKKEEERNQQRLNSIVAFEESWSKKVFEQSATRLEILDREKQEALAKAEELGADKTKIVEYYANEEARILSELEKEREKIQQQEVEAEEAKQKQLENQLRQWEERLFKQTANELELLSAQEAEELSKAEDLGLDKTAIVEYYANERQKIYEREEEEREKIRQKELEAEEAKQKELSDQLRQWEERLFKQTANEIEILEAQKAEELRIAEELGLDKTAIYEYYANERRRIYEHEKEVRERIAKAEAEAEKKRVEDQERTRASFEQSWVDKLAALDRSPEARLEQLETERERIIADAEKLNADVEAVNLYYAKRRADLELEIAESQKSTWQKIMDGLQPPLEQLKNATAKAADPMLGVVKALSTGNWIDALLSIIMETEAFAKAMELLGKVLDPIVKLFDSVLSPIINGILRLWNGVIDALASISIFGWKPFARLTEAKVGLIENKDNKGKKDKSNSGGNQIAEITGPTRDLFVDLLSPLANLSQIVSPLQDIRNILDARLPNLGGYELAGVGAGMSTNITIQNLNVSAPTTGTNDIARASIDDIEKAIAKRLASARRGRGERW